MSSVFEAVKAVPVRAAAEKYGLEVNYAGMVRCPFHEDHTPSLKLYEDHFYCFGCGRHGDVVDLTAELFCIPPYDAASWRMISACLPPRGKVASEARRMRGVRLPQTLGRS